MGSSKAEKNQAEEEEGEIPVLTVLKNNTILKNIFIVNKPPEEHSRCDHEDVLLVGRHPDCDLMLTHPSISRFHLQIRSTPSSRSFSVVDLSSVHGTWVSERKIPPGASVEMNEGDTLRIGVSSRVYRLHWIPISRAYVMENPFVCQLDVVVEQEEEEVQNFNCSAEMEEIQSLDSILECVSSLFLDENVEVSQVTVKEKVPMAPIPEVIFSLCCEDGRKSPSKEEAFGVPSDPFGIDASYCLPEISDGENKLCESLNRVLSPPSVEPVDGCENTMIVEAVLETKMQQFYTPSDTFTSSSPGLDNSFVESVAEDVIPTEFESGFVRDNGKVTDVVAAGARICNSQSMFLRVEGFISGTEFQQIEVVLEDAMDSLTGGEKQDASDIEYRSVLQSCPNSKSSHYYQGHSVNEIVQEIGSKCSGSICPIPFQIESADLSMPQEVVLNVTKENQTLQSCKAAEKNSKTCNIWSRRGKATSAPLRTSKSKPKTAANVDAEVAMSSEKNISNKTILRVLLPALEKEEEEEEIFTPDKENFSPNTLQLRFLKKKGKLEEIKHSTKSRRSCKSKVNFNHGIYSDENICPILSEKKQMDTINKTTSRVLFSAAANVDAEVAMSSEKNIINKTISRDLLPALDKEEEEEIFTPDKENFSPNTLQLRFLKKKGKLEDIKHSSKSRRSCKSKVNSDENTSEKKQTDTINKTTSRDLFSDLDDEEEGEEIFTPDKENFSPNTIQLRLLKKKGKVEEIKRSSSQWSPNSKYNFGPKIYPDENISPTSNKENQTPKGAQVQKLQRKRFSSHIKLVQEQEVIPFNNRVERVPFQPLMNAEGKRSSGSFCAASAVESSIDFSHGRQIIDKHINPSDISRVQRRSWDMIVDTSSLLNKESRKALQLLQGLKGTQLIIPRLVIRELDSMKRQFSIFRRVSEASLALEWIEECMLKTNRWIHIQSSVEEGGLVASTPPASPQTYISAECWTQPFPSHKFPMEIASPTVEDHILDFALLYKRKHNDGQLVLLGEDVTLKIKCMAEGLLCEPVQEFRESLVNPFSGRFLWTNSSPRGQTWCCQDDVVLREKYCRLPLRKSSSKGAVSGLKLILLHNSQYGQ